MQRVQARWWGLLMAVWMLSTAAAAEINTLQRLSETGTLRVGYGDTAPFSYQDDEGNVRGYSIELCQRVAEQLQQQLNLPKLDIEYVFRTPGNRVQLLNSGEIDIECNASTNNAERRRSADFSLSHFFVSVRFVALKENQFFTLQDLAGRSVSVARGTVNVGQINQANREQQLNLSVVPVETLQEAFDLVTEGRVAAFAMDDILLSTMIAESEDPSAYSLSEEAVTAEEPLGLLMRQGDQAFVEQVNQALREIYQRGDILALYERWFLQPLPGKGITLNVPISETLAQHFMNP
ncbi:MULTISPECIES: amino acid ABC transporter substrate-binding protein [Halomonadaceae]|uniref:Amino acid ABC transporter substrate-binding protein n=1 Tax=Vreelandella aquamarina TaxID=77097 RepID=A0A6F8SXR5_9GAMM|nr:MULTISPECIES: amino acid ABC transporter substrate-binding protein [Halomonas]MEC9305880.1 amino acid ABC transporter substrate-binding protein [Pseudomonadota bacterium]MCC4287828.1 amino acid ABC transporter substrate-binding protein [Halomonas meridiana]MCC4291382.1 amino acid ABC transporter substrate-binding protein [Halomonas axialensis]MCD2087095.1 amino acid ABC transporter substrate-binding protein [Halomonas meridiana]MCF2912736.1 amino acid ABC transporter substrate-binding prote|tara:strand:- start:620 stop:1498 length:879 start_codon:yes stop_codon:yes gene_type:complete